ncbi:unnamed protein product [Soboliphyme baturini]|uniref:Uncharacterized protein n=1 Tax=Soboliphyme baturini TaxID=241478 RepID=A0A183J2L7_9BILA|nr:unnamed protein product [Soboliphyme baturini]
MHLALSEAADPLLPTSIKVDTSVVLTTELAVATIPTYYPHVVCCGEGVKRRLHCLRYFDNFGGGGSGSGSGSGVMCLKAMRHNGVSKQALLNDPKRICASKINSEHLCDSSAMSKFRPDETYGSNGSSNLTSSWSFREEYENVTLMYAKHEKIPMKDFNSEVRATMDIDHLLNKAVLLLNLPETSLEEIFNK